MYNSKIMKSSEIIGNKTINDIEEGVPLIKAQFQPFWLSVFDFAFSNMVKKAFYSLRVKNAENFELRDPGKASIIYGCHCCWWDGLVIYILCRHIFKTRMHMMIEELYRFPLLSRVGAFSVEKDSPQSSIKSLAYCNEVLQNPENSIWIFPQGQVMPPDYRPIKFAGGLSYLCKKVGSVNLIPVAHRYNFIREDRPEVFVEVGKPIIIDSSSFNRKAFNQKIEDDFEVLLNKQHMDIANNRFDGYEHYFKSRLCVAKLIEKYFTGFVRNFTT